MRIRDTLQRILAELPSARQQAFSAHPLAQFIRGAAVSEVAEAIGPSGSGIQVQGSAGAGQWAAVPWIAVFDELVTETATRGYYVVYLFHIFEPIVHLSLNQGTTATRSEFKARARDVLMDRAALMRRRLQDFLGHLSVTKIELGSDALLPGDYAAGHALGLTYRRDALPPEAILRDDLINAIAAYRALTFRGGLDMTPETEDAPSTSSLLEERRYRFHRRIERNSKAAKEAKRVHGVRCQACSMSFGEFYSPLGEGFIEVHHLRPIATLEEGVPVPYDVKADFAVLCSNCHRMIHRSSEPLDLDQLRHSLRSSDPLA